MSFCPFCLLSFFREHSHSAWYKLDTTSSRSSIQTVELAVAVQVILAAEAFLATKLASPFAGRRLLVLPVDSLRWVSSCLLASGYATDVNGRILTCYSGA